jgi:hypothetical protein
MVQRRRSKWLNICWSLVLGDLSITVYTEHKYQCGGTTFLSASTFYFLILIYHACFRHACFLKCILFPSPSMERNNHISLRIEPWLEIVQEVARIFWNSNLMLSIPLCQFMSSFDKRSKISVSRSIDQVRARSTTLIPLHRYTY